MVFQVTGPEQGKVQRRGPHKEAHLPRRLATLCSLLGPWVFAGVRLLLRAMCFFTAFWLRTFTDVAEAVISPQLCRAGLMPSDAVCVDMVC